LYGSVVWLTRVPWLSACPVLDARSPVLVAKWSSKSCAARETQAPWLRSPVVLVVGCDSSARPSPWNAAARPWIGADKGPPTAAATPATERAPAAAAAASLGVNRRLTFDGIVDL